ncbi:MAG TPA: rod shape-determining protein MreC [Anaerolineales bacterium]|nr:rod shape-determining protein MreC [Anaerolineales bacterium]
MKNKINDLVIITVIFALIVGLMAVALSGAFGGASSTFNTSLISAQSWISTRFVVLQEFFTIPRDVISLRQRNALLENEVSRLQGQVLSLEKSLAEADILAALVRYSRTNPENSYSAASVIGLDPSPFLRYIIIDKGTDQGILKGMPVITDQGLVGRVDAVINGAARVQLITDAGSAVNVRLEKADQDVILSGSPNGELSLDMLSQEKQLEVGDIVLTSGIGGGFPADLIVGQVINTKKTDSDLFQSASVQPVVDFRNLKLVMVITDFRAIDISPLIQEVQ